MLKFIMIIKTTNKNIYYKFSNSIIKKSYIEKSQSLEQDYQLSDDYIRWISNDYSDNYLNKGEIGYALSYININVL